MNTSVTITQPDDFHLHLRDEKQMESVVNDSAKVFGRAIIMPNLMPPVTRVALAKKYKKRIQLAVHHDFEPMMTLYLTAAMTTEELRKAKISGIIYGVKYYPSGVTTNSNSGVRDIRQSYSVLKEMERLGLPLLIHGEVNDVDVDIFDRENKFLYGVLPDIILHFPKLEIVLEHITTKEAVQFVIKSSKNVAATITAHHLLHNRNQMLARGIRAHYYCLPILKREEDRLALMQAATSGNPKFFLGTDSAPHPRSKKENSCGCAGVYTARDAISFYAKVFDSIGKIDRLEGFSSFFGADFYKIKRNKKKIQLVRNQHKVPESIDFGAEKLIPYYAGKELNWTLKKGPF